MATVESPNGRGPFACQSVEYSRSVFCLRLFLNTFNYRIYKSRIALLFLHIAATVALSYHHSRSFGTLNLTFLRHLRSHLPVTSHPAPAPSPALPITDNIPEPASG
jgi:hypothetical protein